MEIGGPGGKAAFVACCLTPEEIVDHWEEWADVPEAKRLAAVERGQAEVAALLDHMRQNACEFRERMESYASQRSREAETAQAGYDTLGLSG